ncbi:uncharacterized protein FFNC_11372 [Fusarium fujikuroi]|nr:uncharacterized protein FFNC_11372 [Fusarium fujikuroi]
MNRHFNGPTHGLSLDTLNYHGNIHRYNDGGTELWTSIARIIQDELFLQRTLVIWIPKYLGVQKIQHRFYFRKWQNCRKRSSPVITHWGRAPSALPRCRTQKPGLVRQRWMCPDGRIQPEGKFVGKALREPGSILGSRRCPWGASCERRPECEEHYNANGPSQDDIFRHLVAWSDPAGV